MDMDQTILKTIVGIFALIIIINITVVWSMTSPCRTERLASVRWFLELSGKDGCDDREKYNSGQTNRKSDTCQYQDPSPDPEILC